MLDQDSFCAICKTPANSFAVTFDGIHQKCPRCGTFRMSGTAEAILERDASYDPARRAKISGWVFDQNRSGTTPMLSSDMLEQLSARPLPTVRERADRLLLEALREQRRLGEDFDIEEPRFIAATYSLDGDEVAFLASLLSTNGWMQTGPIVGSPSRVLPDGYVAADELMRRAPPSGKGFVAMWFAEDMNDAYEKGFQVGVLNAGYDPIRIDRVPHVNRIDDEILVQIRNAAFVVADFTGQRAGVYFEAGFALALELPVIWTCRKDHMGDLHFDVRQYNCIEWDPNELDDLASRLQYRIEAIAGKGPKASSP